MESVDIFLPWVYGSRERKGRTSTDRKDDDGSAVTGGLPVISNFSVGFIVHILSFKP